MSTLNVSNITDGTTTVGTSYVVNGSAKAWVNFDGTGTIAARDSLNVASLTDNGTGNYTVNLTSSMGNINYCVTTTKQNLNTNTDFGSTDSLTTRSTSSVQVVSLEAGALTDSFNFNAHVAGDLA